MRDNPFYPNKSSVLCFVLLQKYKQGNHWKGEQFKAVWFEHSQDQTLMDLCEIPRTSTMQPKYPRAQQTILYAATA